MSDTLHFSPDGFERCKLLCGEHTVAYRAYMGIPYCAHPVDPIQKLNLFVPEAYFSCKSISGYTRDTAPILLPVPVGGYMPGEAQTPQQLEDGSGNILLEALAHGYVVVSPGIRGRTSRDDARAVYTGKAPALVADAKAVVRFLRHNSESIPGDTERIIISGTSAGGALSALIGATGNCKDYSTYLEAIGAAQERDDVFAANCYCPIHNLEHADMAYEWQFGDFHTYSGTRHTGSGVLTERQIALSNSLRAAFPTYVNSLGLTDESGNPLRLDEQGEGSFKEWVKHWLIRSAQREIDTGDSYHRLAKLAKPGLPATDLPYIRMKDGCVTDLNWHEYIGLVGRMKIAPAFDALDLCSPENEVFGTADINARHFTESSLKYSDIPGSKMTEPILIRMLNPLAYIGCEGTTRHWRIRHGAADNHTAFAIPAILAATLINRGYDVDFHLPWALPHSGDYDLQELFAWIDARCNA